MRLASLLPMLLLAFSIPVAAQNCHIFDLTANVVQVNPLTCQFFVSLDFQHDGTTNQYTVKGNGNNYGTFSYAQVPLILGPFIASQNGPTILEFDVSDAVFQDCHDFVVVDVPACPNGQNCSITNFEVLPGQCDPNGLTYSLLVNFDVQVLLGSSFNVWANGALIGTFPLAALPITIPAFPASGNPIDVIKVCINDQPNCCESLEFQAPACVNALCGIVDLNVVTGSCTSDSTYKATIDFDVVNPVATDSFALWANGQLLGAFGLNQLPLTQEIKWDGGLKDEVKVCIATTVAGSVCCKSIEYTVPACLAIPCGIIDLTVKPDTCTSDSTFHAILNFGVNNPAAVDSFDLWANGEYLGQFGMNQLPLNIADFPWNGLIFNAVKVCTGNTPACCKEYQFLAPDCLPFRPCEITDIFLQTGACTSDSTYKITLNFNATNPGNGTFTVSIHNQLIDTFNLSQVPLTIEVPWNGQAGDFVSICILDADPIPGTVGCCRIKQFLVPACLLPCSIFDVVLDAGDCHPDNNTFDLSLNFHTVNPGNDLFEVWGNGTYLGIFPLASLPIVLPNFPSNGNAADVIKICINDHPDCCKTLEFQGPNCNPDCAIFDISVDPGDCDTTANTYSVTLNFHTTNPGNDLFEAWGNGTYLGIFPLASLPIVIPNFPSNGNAGDVIKICINDHPDCCKSFEFQGPNCNPDCAIFDISVDPGDCDPNANTYSITLNFHTTNPGNDLFEAWGNGTYLGIFPLNALPLVIPNFPSNGNAGDVIKICINDHPDCCKSFEFQGPNCDQPCEIYDLTVQTGDCNQADSTYHLTVNFQVQNPGSNTFSLWANGQFFGTYNLSQLPLHIPNFPWDGNGPNDVIKVCITSNSGALSCCRTLEFPSPDCFPGDCAVHDLVVDTGDCNSDSTYAVVVNFQVSNPPGNTFALWANGQLFGLFNLSQLPLHIDHFPWNGGAHDVIKVCFSNNASGQGACCAEIEYIVPDCLTGGLCDVFDLTATPGNCNPNAATYPLTINFGVSNPGSSNFTVKVNGVNFGSHPISSLPYTIPNVPSNGNASDVVVVCINDSPNCCQDLEFVGPNCTGGGNCEIFDVVLDPGDCNPASNTFNLHLNFQVQNPGNDFYEVWGNGVYLGLFPLSGLPTVINNFPGNGAAIDVIKICINDQPDCCKVIEFQGPNCGSGSCEIFDLNAHSGDCTSDSTYQLNINFQVANPPSNQFQVWHNGQVFGTYNLGQLPLTIQNFPSNGGPTDFIKVCMIPNTPGTVPCCKEVDFDVPNCAGNGDCHIYDLVVLRTPCLCGQFFAVLTFQHENGGPGGFDIVGNGNFYGNFPYDTTQPIILGPFPGDGTTMYEFSVVDHNHPDLCGDEFNLGKVECMDPVSTPSHGTAVLTLSPNPTANWLNVTALLENGAAIGQANVEVYAADGRLAQTNLVANGANFQLDVSALPSGVYRLVLLSDSGRLEGTFAKQ